MSTPSILVLVQGYPSSSDRYNLAYVHTRLLGYLQAGVEVCVLHFGAQAAYCYEGVSVITEADYLAQGKSYQTLIAHAPNLRNHWRFLQGHGQAFPNWIFFFHGHEVLHKQNYYPAPYAYSPRQQAILRLADSLYDQLKLRILRHSFRKWLQQGHLQLVFVSQWMQDAFLSNLRLDQPRDRERVLAHSQIIPNAVHPAFLSARWQLAQPLNADVITIRPLDNPKYAVDQVAELAHQHPHLRFDVFGRGAYFKHYPPPVNLTWHDRFLSPEEMLEVLPHYRAALMPTRLDAQGVMMCELASFGMPLITSDLPICREMLAAFARVHFWERPEHPQAASLPLDQIIETLSQAPLPASQPFAFESLIQQELALLKPGSA